MENKKLCQPISFKKKGIYPKRVRKIYPAEIMFKKLRAKEDNALGTKKDRKKAIDKFAKDGGPHPDFDKRGVKKSQFLKSKRLHPKKITRFGNTNTEINPED